MAFLCIKAKYYINQKNNTEIKVNILFILGVHLGLKDNHATIKK